MTYSRHGIEVVTPRLRRKVKDTREATRPLVTDERNVAFALYGRRMQILIGEQKRERAASTAARTTTK